MRKEAVVPGVSDLREWFDTPVNAEVRPLVVGGLAASEIGGRLLSRIGRRAVDSDAIPALGSFVLGSFAGSGDPVLVVVAFLYGYLIYVFTPTIFPDRVEHVTTRRGFRILTAINALQFPVIAFGTPSVGVRMLSVGAWLLVPLYVVAIQGRSLLGPDGYPIAFADAFMPTVDLKTAYERNPDVQNWTSDFWLASGFFILTSFIFTCLVLPLLGIVLGILYFMYPVPEIVVLGWAGYRTLGQAISDESAETSRRMDIEVTVLSATGVATQGLKGFVSVLLAGAGCVLPIMFLFTGVVIFGQPEFVRNEFTSATATQVLATSVGLLTMFVFAIYGVWYWLRMFSRLQHFMTAWRANLPKETPTEYGETNRPLVARPPGWFVPPTLLLLVFGHMLRYGSWPETPVVPRSHLAVWVACLAVIVWSAYRGLVGAPQPPKTDSVALPAAVAVEGLGAVLWVDIGDESRFLRALTGDISPEQLIAALLASPAADFLFALGSLIYIFYMPDANHYSQTVGSRRLRYVVYFLGGAIGSILAAGRIDGPISYVLYLAAVLLASTATLVTASILGLRE